MLNKKYRIHRFIPVMLTTIILVVMLSDMTLQLKYAGHFTEIPVLMIRLMVLELLWVSIAPSFFMSENKKRALMNAAAIAVTAFVHGCIFQRCCYISWGSEHFPSWGLREMMPPVENYWYLFGICMMIEALIFWRLAHLMNCFKKRPYLAALFSCFYTPMYWAYLWSPIFWLVSLKGCNYLSMSILSADGIKQASRQEMWQLVRQYVPDFSSWIDLFTPKGAPVWEAIGIPTPGLFEMLTFSVLVLFTFLILVLVIALLVQLDGLRFRDDESIALDAYRSKCHLTGFDPGDDLARAKRLVLCVTPPDILDRTVVSFQWTRMIKRYGGFGRDKTGALGFLIGEDYIICPYAYDLLTEAQKEGKEKICMLARRDTYMGLNLEMITDYTGRQYKLMDEYIVCRESEGFGIFLWERSHGVKALYKGHVLKTFLDSVHPVLISAEEEFPLSYLDQLPDIKGSRDRCMAMYQDAKAADDPALARHFIPVLSGEGAAARFYDLMKIAEYCIHIRALLALSAPSEKSRDEESLLNLSLGKMEELQRQTESSKSPADLTIYKALRQLYQGKIRMRSANINLCSAAIVMLRNKYVGHGTMIYHVNDSMLESLSVITKQIMDHYLAEAHRIDENCFIMPECYDQRIPAMKMIGSHPWYFSGLRDIQGEYCIDYMDFDTGRHRFFDMDGKAVRDCFILDRGRTQDTSPMPQPADDLPRIPRYKIYERKGAPLVTLRFEDDPEETESELFNNYPRKMPILGGAHMDMKSLFGWIQTGKRYDGEILHHLAIRAHSPLSLIFVGGQTWDALVDEGIENNTHLGTPEDPGFLDDMAMLKLISIYNGQGSFLPWADVHIVVTGPARYRDQVRNPYPWIRYTDIRYFDEMSEAVRFGLNTTKSSSSGLAQAMARNLVPTFIAGAAMDALELAGNLTGVSQRIIRADYGSRQETYLRITRELGLKSPLLYAGKNIYNAGFIKNILEFKDITTAVIALFDYMEFICLSMFYYAYIAHIDSGMAPDEDSGGRSLIGAEDDLRIHPNFRGNCSGILHYMPEDAPCYEDIHYHSIPVPVRLKQLHKKLGSILNCDIVSDQITFANLASLIGAMRNITKGHGYIRGLEAGILWEILMYDAMMLNRFLHMNEFEMNAYDCVGQVVFGYPEMYKFPSIYMIMDHHIACPLYSIDRKNRLVYMNYFEGKITIPENQ